MLDALTNIAHAARRRIMVCSAERLELTRKGPNEVVTRADREADAFIREALSRMFSGFPILSEEQSGPLEIPTDGFVVDALDGTDDYLVGGDDCGISIAYVQGGKPHTAVLLQIRSGTLVQADCDHGCRLDGVAVRLNHDRPLAESIIASEVGPWVDLRVLTALAGRVQRVRGVCSSTAAAVRLLQGQVAGLVSANLPNRGSSIWDHAGGAAAVLAAGGIVLGLNGQPPTWNTLRMSVLMAASEALAEELIALIQAAQS